MRMLTFIKCVDQRHTGGFTVLTGSLVGLHVQTANTVDQSERTPLGIMQIAVKIIMARTLIAFWPQWRNEVA